MLKALKTIIGPILVSVAAVGFILSVCESREADYWQGETGGLVAGDHCLSRWSGNHDEFERLIKHQLNDPESMKTHSTKISPAPFAGEHTIIVDFSAKNGFGGRVRSQARGTVSVIGCEATLTGID